MKMIWHKKITFAILVGTIGLGFSMPVYAQDSVRGQYNPKTERAPKDTFTAPVPKIFSPKIQHSLVQALKLDTVFQNLKISLWNYATVDFTQQAVLLEKMQMDNFQTTRHRSEFTKDLNGAMTSLNDNYRGMLEQINGSQAEFEKTIEGVTSVEEELLRELWTDKTAELKKQSEDYFKMQHNYVLMYKKLVDFVISKNGSYYFDKNTRALNFYDVADYTFFAGTIDKLNSLSIKQKRYLKDIVPNSDYLTRKDQE